MARRYGCSEFGPLTYATYESHVKNYIEPGIGALRLDHLRVADVQAWLNRLAAQCQCCAQEKDVRRALRGAARCCALGKCCHQVASPRTIKDVRTVLRSALHSAVRQELIDRNVAQLVQIPKQRKRKILPWTSEEARRFLESARSDSDPLYAAYVLVLVLGLRKGEILGLAWDAVNFEQGTLVPDHQLQRVRRSLLYRETKTEASDGGAVKRGFDRHRFSLGWAFPILNNRIFLPSITARRTPRSEKER